MLNVFIKWDSFYSYFSSCRFEISRNTTTADFRICFELTVGPANWSATWIQIHHYPGRSANAWGSHFVTHENIKFPVSFNRCPSRITRFFRTLKMTNVGNDQSGRIFRQSNTIDIAFPKPKKQRRPSGGRVFGRGLRKCFQRVSETLSSLPFLSSFELN